MIRLVANGLSLATGWVEGMRNAPPAAKPKTVACYINIHDNFLL